MILINFLLKIILIPWSRELWTRSQNKSDADPKITDLVIPFGFWPKLSLMIVNFLLKLILTPWSRQLWARSQNIVILIPKYSDPWSQNSWSLIPHTKTLGGGERLKTFVFDLRPSIKNKIKITSRMKGLRLFWPFFWHVLMSEPRPHALVSFLRVTHDPKRRPEIVTDAYFEFHSTLSCCSLEKSFYHLQLKLKLG